MPNVEPSRSLCSETNVPILTRFLILSLAIPLCVTAAQQPSDTVGQRWHYTSDGMPIVVEVVATGIRVPVGIAFLPDGRMLVADRYLGQLHVVDRRTGEKIRIRGLTGVLTDSIDAGLLDVVVHPQYATNGWIYLSYSLDRPGGTTTVVDRAKLTGDSLTNVQRIFEARPVVAGNEHFGGRLLLSNGFLFITVGDRNTRDQAQYLGNHHGKILRLREDGTVPADNPFVGRDEVMPEIWSYGHRNPQGLALQPATGELWENEHGPKGGDEINVIRRGANYGWPLITYGQEYYGAPVGKGLTQRTGLEQPIHYWVPSIAPSGLAFYTGSQLTAWRGNLFSGAMAKVHLNRLVLDGHKVVKEERLFEDRRWRVRSVVQGPDGFLYLGVDGGMVVRIRPGG